MKKILIALLPCILAIAYANAQADHKLDSETIAKDQIIKLEIIRPTLKAAREQDQVPDWNILHNTIATRFDGNYAERNVTKAQIFFYYGRDWARFSTAVVQYTQKYEWRDSLSLMNLNARMVLANSANPSEWKAAQSWVKYAMDKSPSDEGYKDTYDALTAKLNGK